MRFKPLGKEEFTVKIDSIDITESLNIDLNSLRWREVLNASAEADFILGIPYDSEDKPSLNATVEILFNDVRKFYGYITNISKSSQPENLAIHAEGEYIIINKEKVTFLVGREPDESFLETYYTTYAQALVALGWEGLDIGDFVPYTESYYEANKADTISSIVQQCGNFKWFIRPDGTKKLWKGGKGSIISLERQSIGTDLGLFQVINHSIREDDTNKIDKLKVIMGEDIKPGYDNTYRDVRLWNRFIQKVEQDPKIYSIDCITEVGWVDLRADLSDEDSKEVVYDGWRITVPAGYEAGFPLEINPRTSPFPLARWGQTYYTIKGLDWYSNMETLDENIAKVTGWYHIFDMGGIYPEGRKEYIFYIGEGDITRTLNLSNLNRQFGCIYKHTLDRFPYSFQRTDPGRYLEGLFIYPGMSIYEGYKEDTVTVFSWDDTVFAADVANLEYYKYKDTKIVGNLNITFDCAEYYGLDLARRIECSGILDEPVNIKSINYDVGNYSVTINVESENYYKRSVSVPEHKKSVKYSRIVGSHIYLY